jgi:hypothetical protein
MVATRKTQAAAKASKSATEAASTDQAARSEASVAEQQDVTDKPETATSGSGEDELQKSACATGEASVESTDETEHGEEDHLVEGVNYRFIYMTKTQKSKHVYPDITFRGDLELSDLVEPAVRDMLRETSKYFFNYGLKSVLSKTYNKDVEGGSDSKGGSAKNGNAATGEASVKVEGGDEGIETEAASDDEEKTGSADVETMGWMNIWFPTEDHTEKCREYFFELLQSGYAVEGRSIEVQARLYLGPSENKKELEDLMMEFGAKESPQSKAYRKVVFKGVPAKLTEDTVRTSLPDVEHIEFRQDKARAKCMVATLPSPDRAATVISEKDGAKGFGSIGTLRAFLMHALDSKTLMMKPNMKYGPKRPSDNSNRGGRSGNFNAKRGRGNYSGGTSGRNTSSWSHNRGGYDYGVTSGMGSYNQGYGRF